jgi:O-6-methylguanine DNA methyltransferase
MLQTELRTLRQVRAPEGFAGRVLAAVGLVERYALVETPIGGVYVAWNEHGISAVMPSASESAFRRRFAERFERPAERGELPATLRRVIESGDAAEARRLRYDLRVCSEFETAVLRKALEIPRGQVRPYGWIAREIGRPKAVRAVGSALAKNPVPLLIPCHRVVRSDGTLGEYALGAPQKVTLLKGEGLDVARFEREGRAGIRFHGSATTKIFCLPSCSDMRRAKAQNVRTFRSEGEARDAGYRPCKHCRPVAA